MSMSALERITELERKNAALRRRLDMEHRGNRPSERFFDLAADSGDWLWEIDMSGKYTFSTDAVKAILGYASEEMIGRHFYDFFHPEDKESLMSSAMGTIRDGHPFVNLRNRNIHKDGHTVILETTGFPLTDDDGNIIGFRGADRDITAQEDALLALQASRKQWRALYKGIPIPTVTWRHVGGDFELIDYNDAIEQLSGGKIAEHHGRKASEIYPDRAWIPDIIRRCYETHETQREETDYQFITTGEKRAVWATFGFVPPDMVVVHLIDITSHREAEKALQEANSDMQRILDAMGEGLVVLNAENEMTRLNRASCDMFGYHPSEILGKRNTFWTHPDSRERLADELAKRKRGERSTYEARYVRKDGSGFWTRVIAVPIIDADGVFQGSVGCLSDITGEKQALEELRRLHDFNEKLIKTASVWINATDREGNITLWNDEAEKITGYGRSEVIGNGRIWEWLYPDPAYRSTIWQGQESIRSDDESSERIETIIRTKSGEERIIAWYGRPLFEKEGNPSGWVIVGHDVTKARHTVQQLQDYATQVLKLNREKNRFLSFASHELRTPLTIIRGFADLLSEDTLNPDQKDKIARIQVQIDRLTALLTNLLNISRIDAGEANLKLDLIDLAVVTSSVIDNLSPYASTRELTISHSNEKESVIAYANGEAVEQVVMNLLTNAINYTPRGGEIKVVLQRDENKARILVSDTGIGIRKAEMEKIFAEFHRTDHARKMKATGNGLGLSIVRRLVEEMNGSVWASSAGRGKGSAFSVTLPSHAPKEKLHAEIEDCANTDL